MNTVSPTLLDQWIAFEIVQRDSGESTGDDPDDAKQSLEAMVSRWQK
jgi:hypothetical protein